MKPSYLFISRLFIGLVFLVAGVQKLMTFTQTSGFIGGPLGLPLPVIVTALVVIVEIPVALMYIWGYRVCVMGSILMAFTLLATILVHRNFGVGDNMIMALKNLSIIGGLLATSKMCDCGMCNGKKG